MSKPLDYRWSKHRARKEREDRKDRNIPEWEGEISSGQMWRKGGRNHWDIYIEVRMYPEHITKEIKWTDNNWDKQKVFEKIKSICFEAYSIDVYNKPKNSKVDDIIWKNPEWKPKSKTTKINKLPIGNTHQGYHEGNYGQNVHPSLQ